MDDPFLTAAEIRVAWRDAVRAAELAARLANLARDASDRADRLAVDAGEIATLAAATADAADRAASAARAAVTDAMVRTRAVDGHHAAQAPHDPPGNPVASEGARLDAGRTPPPR